MRLLLPLVLTLFAASPALAAQPLRQGGFNPAADYVTAGQDEPGYRRWYAAASWRPIYVRAFHNYLVSNGVAGVAPTWQLLRTATDWQRCGADPFEVPPTSDWGNIVATLRFIGAYIVPVVGPVEPVSVYRNPMLNACAGGAQASTHREMGAVDIVPLRPIDRQGLMLALCSIHAAHPESNSGLGFYKGLRFHIDARKYREWGTAAASGGYGCSAVLAESAGRYAASAARAQTPPAVAAPVVTEPLAAAPSTTTSPPAPSATQAPITDRLAPLGQ